MALDKKAPAIPCGLIAKSLFNDTYSIKDSNSKTVDINEKDIAWETDKEYKFKNTKDGSAPDSKKWDEV